MNRKAWSCQLSMKRVGLSCSLLAWIMSYYEIDWSAESTRSYSVFAQDPTFLYSRK